MMNSRSMRILIAIMSVSLLGLVAIQFFWVRHMIHLKDSQFRDNFNSALHELVDQIDVEQDGEFIAVNDTGWQHIDSAREQRRRTVIIREFGQGVEDTFIHDQIDIMVRSDEADLTAPLDHNEKQHRSKTVIFHSETNLDTGEQLHKVIRLDGEKGVVAIRQRELDTKLKRILGEYGIKTRFELKIGEENPFNNVWTPDDKANSREAVFHKALHTGEGGDNPNSIFVKVPESRSSVLDHMNVILPTSGLLIMIISICFGLTLWTFYRQKKISEMKSDFINNMTHEFKTPISTISLAGQALMDPELEHSAEQREKFTSVIIQENQRLQQHVDRVLEIARLERGDNRLKLEQLDGNDAVLEEAGRYEQQVAGLGGRIDLDLQAQDSSILADKVHFAAIISNLIDNAVKYSPEQPKILLHTHNKDNQLEITITDHGIGMSKEVQRKVFDKFFRAQSGNVHDVKGFGLGLNYVKKMVEAHGGEIGINSEPGQGTTVALRFPLQQKNS